MSSAAKTILAHGIYLFLAGAFLVLAPNEFAGMLNVAGEAYQTQIIGILMIAFATFYALAVSRESRMFFRWTIYARAGVGLSFVILTWLGTAPPILIVFAAIDFIGSTATLLAMRTPREEERLLSLR